MYKSYSLPRRPNPKGPAPPPPLQFQRAPYGWLKPQYQARNEPLEDVIKRLQKINEEITAEKNKANETIEKLRREKEQLQKQLDEVRSMRGSSGGGRDHTDAKVPHPHSDKTVSFSSLLKQKFGGSSNTTRHEKSGMELWKSKALASQKLVENLTKALETKKNVIATMKTGNDRALKQKDEETKELRSKLDLEMKKNAANEKLKRFFIDEKSGRLLDFDGFLRKVEDVAMRMGMAPVGVGDTVYQHQPQSGLIHLNEAKEKMEARFNQLYEEMLRTIRNLEEQLGENFDKIGMLQGELKRKQKDLSMLKEEDKLKSDVLRKQEIRINSIMNEMDYVQNDLKNQKKTNEKMKLVWNVFQNYCMYDGGANGNGNMILEEDNTTVWKTFREDEGRRQRRQEAGNATVREGNTTSDWDWDWDAFNQDEERHEDGNANNPSDWNAFNEDEERHEDRNGTVGQDNYSAWDWDASNEEEKRKEKERSVAVADTQKRPRHVNVKESKPDPPKSNNVIDDDEDWN